MPKTRWEQIHRFLTFNRAKDPTKGPWFASVEPVASIIRGNCQAAVTASTWIAVDEAMAAFTGRSRHKVNLPGKPIPEGYKIWVLGLQGG